MPGALGDKNLRERKGDVVFHGRKTVGTMGEQWVEDGRRVLSCGGMVVVARDGGRPGTWVEGNTRVAIWVRRCEDRGRVRLVVVGMCHLGFRALEEPPFIRRGALRNYGG